MLNQIINAAFRILFFRAGPQDFPYAPRASLLVLVFAVCAHTLVGSISVPPFAALLGTLASLGGVAMVTRAVLQAKKFENRFRQAFDSLIITSALLTLLALPAVAQLAPVGKMIAEHPELMSHPDAVQIQPMAVLTFLAVIIWDFAVTTWIYSSAVEAKAWVGALIAFIAAMTSQFLGSLAVALVAAPG